MRLVNRQGGDIPVPEVLLPVVEHETLGGRVEQAELPLVQPAQAGSGLRDLERGIQNCRRDARRVELVHLILHQRDQRRDHNRQSVAQQRRKLKTKRLSTAGRQQCKRVPPGQRGLDDLPLERAEFVVSERLF